MFKVTVTRSCFISIPLFKVNCLIYLQVRNEGHLIKDSAVLNINRMFSKYGNHYKLCIEMVIIKEIRPFYCEKPY